MFQEADFLLGDIGITWERLRAVEFSFFTLADSGAFVTHYPKRLNEALALVRPFRWEVWPPLVFTIAVTGPLFYFVIAMPFWWKGQSNVPAIKRNEPRAKNQIRWYSDRHINVEYGALYLTQLNRMRFGPRTKYMNPTITRQKAKKGCKRTSVNRPSCVQKQEEADTIPHDLLNKCIWFAITMFLRQCKYRKQLIHM